MKNILAFSLAFIMLCIPLSGAFASELGTGTFTADLGRLRRDLEDADPIVTDYNYTYNDVARVTSYCVDYVLNDWSGSSPYYFAVPTFSRTADTGSVTGFNVSVYISDSDSFTVGIDFPNPDLNNATTSIKLLRYSSDSKLYRFTLSKYYLTSDIRPSSPSVYGSTSTIFLNKIQLITGRYTSDRLNFDTQYRCIDNIEYLTLQSSSNCHAAYIPYGETEPDPDVEDFFSVPSLSVILSTGGQYLWHRSNRTAKVLTACGVGLAALLIGLRLLPKVLRKFGIA